MPTDFKTKIDNSGSLERAARARVQDYDHQNFSEKQIQIRANRFMKRENKKITPDFAVGNPLNSTSFTEFYRDSKFFIHLNNSQLTNLQREVENAANRNLAILNDLEKDVASVDSFITEKEIKTNQRFTTVQYNAFVKEMDAGLGAGDNRWLVDFKTGLPFQKHHGLNLVQGTGLTLPVRDQVVIPVRQATLVGEETDAGSTKQPLYANSPNNLLVPNKIFRYVILRKTHDKTTRIYQHANSTVTILLEFHTAQLINFIQLEPLGHSSVFVNEITTINQAGEEVTMLGTRTENSTTTTYLLEPVRTRYLKIKLGQFAPVTKTSFRATDKTTDTLNEVLQGLGWTTRLPQTEEVVEGIVYDFSLKNIRVGLNIYESLGIHRGLDIPISEPLGLTLGKKVDSTTLEGPYGLNTLLSEGTVLSEFYVGAHLMDVDSNLLLEELIPIPDQYPTQVESLPLIGGQSRVKLFPDIVWELDRFQVAETAFEVAAEINVVTISAHSFTVGQQVAFLGNNSSPLTNIYEVIAVADSLNFTIKVNDADSTYVTSVNSTPYIYVYEADTLLALAQDIPFTVRENNITLTLGTDYLVSFNNGDKWYSTMPQASDLFEAALKPKAGDFRIQIKNPAHGRIYWISYKIEPNQQLDSKGLVSLKNGRVLFEENGIGKGTLNTIAIIRAQGANHYITPVVSSYALKIREDVT